LLAVTDEEGYTQRFYYNAYGNLVKSELTPDNKVYYVSTFNYDCVGNKIRQVDARGNASTFKYDGLGRLLAKTDELGYSTYYTYNGMNKLLTMEEPGGRVTEYVYDELGRVKVEKIYKKGTADFVFTRYEYDGADNIISVKKGSMANGKETILVETGFTYNIMNRVTDEYRRIDDTSAAHIKYDYDSNGRKTSVIEYANPEKSKYRSYKYEYDFAGRLISEKGAYTVNGIAGGAYGSYFREFEYDYEGNLLKQVIYNGNDSLVITYEYDYRNLPVTKTEPFTSQSSRITKYAYDRKGNLLSETIIRQGKESTVSYIYDGLGRVTARFLQQGA
jgi:YD repeat-containing protein